LKESDIVNFIVVIFVGGVVVVVGVGIVVLKEI